MARTQRTDSQRARRSRPTPRWLMTKTDLDVVARNRVMLVLSVLSGERPVTTAIEEAGISRGFYYQLETKALNAMLLALAPGTDGEPSPDATGLHARIKQLEEKLTGENGALPFIPLWSGTYNNLERDTVKDTFNINLLDQVDLTKVEIKE